MFDQRTTPSQIATVEESLGGLDVPAVADDLYRRAFAADPGLTALFGGDPEGQRRRFAAELRAIVGSIRDLDAFRAEAAALGARHRRYGVRAGHYRTVGAALLASLAAALGDDWTDEVAEAWTLAYNLISEAMLAGTLERRAVG